MEGHTDYKKSKDRHRFWCHDGWIGLHIASMVCAIFCFPQWRPGPFENMSYLVRDTYSC